ncbi:MAG: hypothetical protein AAFW89_09865 [Bacteroidota bacterium]
MKLFALLSLFLALAVSIPAEAQFRRDLGNPNSFSGTVINSQAPTVQSALSNFFRDRVVMQHSYEMSFSSFGGNYQNLNAYTNTMFFNFSPRLNGRVDVSLMHSPFGGNIGAQNNGMNAQVMIRNAELNYQISDNTVIRFQYQQLPFGFSPFQQQGFGGAFGPFGPGVR